MVVLQYLQDYFELSNDLNTFSLPVFKGNNLAIKYSDTKPCNDLEVVYKNQEPLLPFASSNKCLANICDWRQLTLDSDSCKAVYELSLDVTGSNYTFVPGDTIGVIPKNDDSEVNSIITHLNLTSKADLEYDLSLDTSQKGAKIPVHIPIKATVRHALSYCCDIRGVLKKLFLLELSKHTSDKNEKLVLEYLCSKEGSQAYTTHILNKQFCLLDLFNMFQCCKPPVETLFAHLPRLLPRPYSIVNSYMKNNNHIKICFSVMEISKNRKGLVTGWLEKILTNVESLENRLRSLNLNVDCKSKVPIYLRKNISGFSLPENTEIPMILIGTGTGVAPFIGFLEERQCTKLISPNKTYGEICLFFGCRNPKSDYIYENELSGFLMDGTLNKLYTSFSRAGDESNKYVQDALMQNGEEVAKLIETGAMVFVCGDQKNMVMQVQNKFVDILVKFGEQSQLEAEKFISDMQARKMYLVDVWS